MWVSMPLMTVSTAVIIVLHSVEVVHVPHASWLSLDSEYSLYWRAPLHTSEVWARKSLQGCSIVSSNLECTHWGFSCHSYTHTIWQFSHRSFIEHHSGSAIVGSLHNRLVRQDWTLPHTMPGHTHIGSWLYYFHGWSLHELVLRFGYDN
jgi:hypothetical protein